MGLGVYSIQRSVMKRGYGATPGFRSSCVMLHYGCCENQLEPSNLASSAMKKSDRICNGYKAHRMLDSWWAEKHSNLER